MSSLLTAALQGVLRGEQLGGEQALHLFAHPDLAELLAAADTIRRQFCGPRFHLCSIINAKSGNCSEDCRFCAQSARHRTAIDSYEFIATGQALAVARDNEAHGVPRLSLVTSGRTVSAATLARLAALYSRLRRETSLTLCGSLGLLTQEQAAALKEMGVERYHCNLESCRAYFAEVCTTHTWEDKVETLRHARSAGMSVCSGGIIGLGEPRAHRIALALELRELGITSIPLNILTPIAHTPLAALDPLAPEEVLRTIACFRFLNPGAVIRVAGGRQLLGAEQYRAFRAGANGAIVGNYLTTIGSGIAEDLRALRKLGYQV